MCVILYTIINGKKILAKNRDRTYNPHIKLIHEIVNGLEIAYIKDEDTGWIEGMDENGFALVNSTLSVNDSKHMSQKRVIYKSSSKKKNKIYYILTKKNKSKFFHKILENHKIKNYKTNLFLEGHSLMALENGKIYHIENNSKDDYVVNNINENTVFTNSGQLLKNEGYTYGRKAVSSFLRKKIVEKELDDLFKNKKNICYENVYTTISQLLNKNYVNLDPLFHTYRDKNFTVKKHKELLHKRKLVNTTSQLIFNITDKEFVFYNDINNSANVNYINKLPKNTVPKIKITIKKTEKNSKHYKIFNEKYLKKVYKKFNYTKNKTQKIKH
jgi:hypothetical protein